MNFPFLVLMQSGATGNSCAELLQQGHRRSGLYHLRLPGARSSFWQLLVHCDQDSAGGGWMVSAHTTSSYITTILACLSHQIKQ